MRRYVSIGLLIFGCGGGGGGGETPQITTITPSFAPLAGGTRVVITGQGFLADGAPPNRVVFGSNEAPLAAAVTDTSLEVDVPPSTMAGNVPVIVFNQNGSTTAMGMFHYSAAPTITQVTPTEVLFSATNTTVTLTGTGFQSENAGVVQVTLDGEPALDVNVASDTQLTFTVLNGPPLVEPVIQLTDARGTASSPGFRYVPSTNPGLIFFTKAGGCCGSPAQNASTMAVYYDPVNNIQVQFPQKGSTTAHVRATFVDANGDIWGAVGGRRGASTQHLGKLDFHSGAALQNPVAITSAPAALALVGTTLFAYDRQTGSFGKLDQTTGAFTSIATQLNFCCQILFVHNNQLFYSAGTNQLTTLDTTTGKEGTVVTLSPTARWGDMRFLGNTLYGVDLNGNLYTINPATGAVSASPIHTLNVGVSAMEVFQP